MSTSAPTQPHGWRHPHRWVIVVVLLVLLAIGLVTYGYAHENAQANDKAEQLITALQDAGLPAPADKDTIVNVLGDDGGPVCEDPGAALRKALVDASLVNGASFVGQRPIRASTNLLRGGVLVLRIYCPDKIDDFKDQFQDYKFDDVSKN